MNQVHIVFQGRIGNNPILKAAFSSKEKADEFARVIGGFVHSVTVDANVNNKIPWEFTIYKGGRIPPGRECLYWPQRTRSTFSFVDEKIECIIWAEDYNKAEYIAVKSWGIAVQKGWGSDEAHDALNE